MNKKFINNKIMKRRREESEISEYKYIDTPQLLAQHRKKWRVYDKTSFHCNIKSDMRQCKLVSQIPRMLESRSACIYEFLKKYGFNNIFTNAMTIPIVLSFIENTDLRNKLFDIVYKKFIPNNPSDLRLNKEVGKKLLECNIKWNTKMYKEDLLNILRNLDVTVVGNNPLYYNTLEDLQFLSESYSIVNRPNFISRSGYWYSQKNTKAYPVDKKLNAICAKMAKNCQSPCFERISLDKKKSCVNKQIYRDFSGKLPKPSAYYIMNSEQTNQLIMYVPLCLYHAITGNIGIFRKIRLDSNKKPVKDEPSYTITFPLMDPKNYIDTARGFYTFYYKSYLYPVNIRSGRVGIHDGFLTYITKWYKTCFEKLGISKNAHINLVGVSLGAGLANVATFYLLQQGYINLHMYAFGSPRVGDINYNKYMNSTGLLSKDSANYVRFTNIVKKDVFYTQFDPVCKFPPSQDWTIFSPAGYSLKFVDNPRLKIMNAGLLFNPILGCYYSQPDYNMIDVSDASRLNRNTPLGSSCVNYWSKIHSLSTYDVTEFVGHLDAEGKRYNDYFDAVYDIEKFPCEKHEDNLDKIVKIISK